MSIGRLSKVEHGAVTHQHLARWSCTFPPLQIILVNLADLALQRGLTCKISALRVQLITHNCFVLVGGHGLLVWLPARMWVILEYTLDLRAGLEDRRLCECWVITFLFEFGGTLDPLSKLFLLLLEVLYGMLWHTFIHFKSFKFWRDLSAITKCCLLLYTRTIVNILKTNLLKKPLS